MATGNAGDLIPPSSSSHHQMAALIDEKQRQFEHDLIELLDGYKQMVYRPRPSKRSHSGIRATVGTEDALVQRKQRQRKLSKWDRLAAGLPPRQSSKQQQEQTSSAVLKAQLHTCIPCGRGHSSLHCAACHGFASNSHISFLASLKSENNGAVPKR